MKNIPLVLFVILGANLSSAQSTTKDTTSAHHFQMVDKSAEFPGGLTEFYSFIERKLYYPSGARKAKIQGKVYVKFVIMEDGTVNDVEVVYKLHPALDKEAVRVIKLSPKWVPGMYKGEKVRQNFTLPVVFTL